ncbi:helix-turn-helix domain-containing protein [Bradyrhizobium sp.]|uniref:helix-turn-helix domain-containing protein n=1 Tax=Bradyrhizobium sp. TaxID=376 RepID=UPI003C428285
MKTSVVAVEPTGHFCVDCSVRQFSLCAPLDKSEIREFEQLGRQIQFAPCETVFAQEEMTTSFYNLLEGVMRVYKLLPDGRRQIVGFALPGDFLGMSDTARHGFSADAIGPVSVCRFGKSAFSRFAEDKPHLLRRINELAVHELNQARDHMVLLGRRSAEEKVATFLIGWRDRLDQLRGASASVPLPMSRQDIADYLGLTIETVSRTFTKLEREGVIEIIPGGVCLRDPERAAALAAA